ncbi:FABP family protein [Actinomyces culturomici]|uniref:FABP family protein n=1 Tax=Actinomyces culturomici TaxID=1926276 RepID=UPI000E1FD9A7|nr:heme-binding beta-barrel domain-containing protein [Actinomyces culturomici]
MMVIPADLPASLAPVAWMLGTWKGWGMRAVPGDDPDTAIIEEIVGDIRGDQMRLVTSIYEGLPARDAEIAPTWNAEEGLKRIARGDLLLEETLYLSVLPGSGVLPPPGQYEPREFTATSALTNSLGVLWAGVGVGPRVQMVSDAIARGSGADEIEHLGRMYGLVADELMWTQERTLAGVAAEAEVEMSGRLMRTAQARTASGEEIDGIDAEAEGGFLV